MDKQYRAEEVNLALVAEIMLLLMGATRGPGQAYATLVLCIHSLSKIDHKSSGRAIPSHKDMVAEFDTALFSIKGPQDATH